MDRVETVGTTVQRLVELETFVLRQLHVDYENRVESFFKCVDA